VRVAVTGGGTGGHVYPAIAIARYLIAFHPETGVVFIGSSSGPEAAAVPDQGIDFEGLRLLGFSRKPMIEKIKSAILFVRGTLRCLKILKRYEVTCVVGTGGYAAAPACFAALIRRIPFILHEMNYRPGIVTRLLCRSARAVTLAFEGTAELLPQSARTVLTGVPVRPEIEALRDDEERTRAKREALGEFGIQEGKKTVVIFGGSQGSEAINGGVWNILPGFAERENLQVIHLTGDSGFESARRLELEERLEGKPLLYRSLARTDRMELAYSVADIVLARAGGSTIAELTSTGVPSVLVPFPYAAGAHQEENAGRLAEYGATKVVKQEGDYADSAVLEALRLIEDSEALKSMMTACADFYRGDAAKGIVALIRELR
jgi:UDP-N-acetylglucosamine--N-acetylmuramyl-(pentapeptide) pyrophosphoryl-undecaprenol N-acetylglucosamine transferase